MSSSSSPDSSISIKFVPFTSSVESSFWVKYCDEKLNTIQLNEDPIDIVASYSPNTTTTNGGLLLECRENSLSSVVKGNEETAFITNNNCGSVIMHGKLIGYNTVEAFQKVNKNELLKQMFLEDQEKQQQEEEGEDSSTTTTKTFFIMLTYADLKNHKVLYWFGIPAIATQQPGCSIRATKYPEHIATIWNKDEYELLYRSFWDLGSNTSLSSYFLFTKEDGCVLFNEYNYNVLSKKVEKTQDIIFGFVDSSSSRLEEEGNREIRMGWPMRNLIAKILFWKKRSIKDGSTISVLSFRPSNTKTTTRNNLEDDNSLLLQVQLPKKSDYYKTNISDDNNIKIVGWETNVRGRMGPRMVNLQPLLDPNHLAIQAADLNLKLMKWRMIPSLNVELLQERTKVLLLGAGTLGCAVARTLLGWGVRHFTIVDNGTVSYSNPVRQSLFTMKDCQNNNKTKSNGTYKSIAAASALKEIAADVHAKGIVLSIPMPGHDDDRDTLESSVKQLDQLIKDCDVVYLLTDTRESRWLPTVMAATHNKLLLNAALGLDSWLVMRHGGDTSRSNKLGTFLGCYFCNDVVAPENSMKNRTLDQQCTVTRPGLAPIAASMAVELMVALLHHPKQHDAPAPKSSTSTFSTIAPTTNDDENTDGPLGIMPHQIRGSLVSYTMMTPTVPAFKSCTGCSVPIINAYRNNPTDLVCLAAKSNGSTYLEDLSGLTTFRAQAESQYDDMMMAMENDSDSDNDIDDW